MAEIGYKVSSKVVKRYRVDYYDIFDGWICRGDVESVFGYDYATQDEAIRKCRELNRALDAQNIKAGEHWGVIDLEMGRFLGASGSEQQ